MQTLICGLLGIPPVNGVLPQAPMHTRSLAHLRTKQKQPDSLQLQPGSVHSDTDALNDVPAEGFAAANGNVASSAAVIAVDALPSLQPAVAALPPGAAAAPQLEALQRRGSSELRHRSHHHSPERQQDGAQQQQQHGLYKQAGVHLQQGPQQQQQQPQARSLKVSDSAVVLNTLPDSAGDAVVGVPGSEDAAAATIAHTEGHFLQLQVSAHGLVMYTWPCDVHMAL
jgi:hypothetical protein